MPQSARSDFDDDDRRQRREIGARVRARREYRGISRYDAAQALGVAEAAFGHYETGHSELSASKVVQLADILSTTVGYILGEMSDEQADTADALHVYAALRPDLRAIARAQMKVLLDAQEGAKGPE